MLNANKLGTDEEFRFLKYISENVPKIKVILVLNKLDDFKSNEDSITASIEGVRKDLLQLGYENPVICPLSAYFALRLKMKQNGYLLTEDEQDTFDFYLNKFSKAEYDLSSFSDEIAIPIRLLEYELSALGLKCGLCGLEIYFLRRHGKMKEIFIKYNPYKLETEITVGGKGLAQNSELREKSMNGSRLQEWVEELPHILIDECNDTDFEITFHGTLLDYEDVENVFKECDNDKLKITFTHKPAKETANKELLIGEVFKEIQNGPFDELRDNDIKSAFDQAKSSDFEVCVVATMSAGKSTLINAMLGTKLMPSKQEACPAIITRIKDCYSEASSFKAEVYNQEEVMFKTYENLTYKDIEDLISDENISVIHVTGNIPFVSSEDVSLVLIDTPGPNNSRDKRHKKVQSEFLSQSSKALILYIMTGEFGTDDDNTLLNRVAESMSVGGKQSKDRFIFVVNKLDDRKPEDGDTDHTLEKVRAYLKTHGISNPNLFPASALTALNIRLIKSGPENVDYKTRDDTESKVKKFNSKDRKDANGQPLKPLHFETYAPLPPSLCGEISGHLESTRSEWDGRDNENPDEALIHTGIVSIEAAIRQYVLKYAHTAKIKSIVDTFKHKLDEVGCFEETKCELAQLINEREHNVKLLDSTKKKIESANAAKKFKDDVDDEVKKMDEELRDIVNNGLQIFKSHIIKRLYHLRNKKFSLDEANNELDSLTEFLKELQLSFDQVLDNLIRKRLLDTGIAYLETYKEKLVSLKDEIDIANPTYITIDPLKLISESFSIDDLHATNFAKGNECWNMQKKAIRINMGIGSWIFSEFLVWCINNEHDNDINGSELESHFLSRIEKSLSDYGYYARNYAEKQSKKITKCLNEEFPALDDILKTKVSELASYAKDKEKVDERVRDLEGKLKWLNEIKNKVEAILEI